MVIKYVCGMTTHGNYVLVKAEMKPVLKADGTPDFFTVSRWGRSPGRYVGIKASYKPHECFDSEIDAKIYAEAKCSKFRQKLIDRLKKNIDYLNSKISKLENQPPKVRYLKLV
jgi:tRNA(Glu) U13 pseudouridine synthase TruD